MLQRKLWIVAFGWAISAGLGGALEPEAVESLIKKLGSSRFVERERAQKELESLGADALPALKKAIKEGDLEIKSRAGDMVRRLEEKLLTDNVLTPKTVQLSLKDVSVADALKELSKQSGYPIHLQGDLKSIEERKVTLETGKVSFWEAFDKLCSTAGVAEQSPLPTKVKPPINRLPIRPIPRPLPAPLPAVPGVLPVPQIAPLPAPALRQLAPQNPIDAKAPALFDPKQVGQAPPAEKAPDAKKPEAQPQAQPQAQQPAPPFPNLPPVANQKVQVQFQIQGGGVVVMENGFIGQPGAANGITVGAAQPKVVPTSYSGAVRVRLLEPTAATPKKAGASTFVLDVTAEPKLQNFVIQGSPKIDKAIDDQDQTLKVVAADPADPNVNGNPNAGGILIQNAMARIDLPNAMNVGRQIPLNLQLGEKRATALKELTGSLTASVLMPAEEILSIKDFEKGAGKSFQGKNGGEVHLNSIEKTANGFKIDMTIEQPRQGANANVFGNVNGVVMIGGATGIANSRNVPDMVDAKGKKYVASQQIYKSEYRNGTMRYSSKVTYTRANNAEDAERLVMHGQRTTMIEVPFAFKDVPLK